MLCFRSLRATVVVPCGGILVALLTGTPSFAVEHDPPMGWVGRTFDDEPCHGKGQGPGPYDYRDPAARFPWLAKVEGAHFTRDVEALDAPLNSGHLNGNIDYTLRAFPNHHRALDAIIRLKLRGGKVASPVECYLQRAEAFRPDDGTVKQLFGLYYHRLGRHEKALAYYEKALETGPETAEMHYHMGLLLLAMGRPREAVEAAHKAYAMGYPLPGLKRMLAKQGHTLPSDTD
jgi:tetratricopeptide (TPR) repeat protein